MKNSGNGIMAKNKRELASVQLLGEYRLSAAAPGGWDAFRLFKSPFFIKALFLMGVFGCITGGYSFLYILRFINEPTFNTNRIFIITLLFGGGLLLIGELNIKRSIMIVFFAFTAICWENHFIELYEIKIFILIAASWLIFWWVWKKPDMMKRFGLRKELFFQDTIKAMLPLCLILIYIVISVMIFGLRFEISPWKNAVKACSILPYNLMVFMFFFLVLNELQNQGMDWKGYVLTIFLLAFLYQSPVFAVYFGTGKVSLIQAIAGIIANTLLLLLIIITTFNSQRNILLAVMLETSFMVILDMVGLM